ncbi:C40 family peptidase [Paenibacillus sp. P96]|uniref:C40 family peptidase n=1 Tax=Paenibacillus zeirhizosphaerae TaxID=2987519 RepID=A0ABT9FX89_9BACL|nr:C40 family peptidase [Paenibacillus sp. P96]MDP4099340.1 C40 family peptidase [Paenibacillus sp. P96]
MNRSVRILSACFAVILLFSLIIPGSAGAAGESCAPSQAVRKHYINVSVATLWKEPSINRTLDQPSLTSPVDIRKWTASMSVSQRRWLTGRTETQALYGQEVRLLQVKGSWVKVAVVDQATSKSQYGYPGWLPSSQVMTTTSAYDGCPFVVVSAKTAVLYKQDKQSKALEVSFNTRLPVAAQEDSWIKVHTPAGGTAWLKAKDALVYEQAVDIPQPSGTDLVHTAKRFLGLPYLWAGGSAYGFDCSGFTSAVYAFHGIKLPRDASEQIKEGRPIALDELQPGDLLFFAYNQGKGKVHHVAMYAGDGKMIHSPKAGKTVEIIPISTPEYAQEFAGARRYIGE